MLTLFLSNLQINIKTKKKKQVPPPSSAPTLILAPAAYDDNYNTIGTTPVVMEVCINDLPGTGGTQPFVVTLVTAPEAGGTLTAAGCTMTYSPNPTTTPPYVDHFRYTVTDETGTSPAALVTIRVAAAPFEQSSRPDGGDTPTGNGGPVAVVDAVDDSYVMIKNTGSLAVVSIDGGMRERGREKKERGRERMRERGREKNEGEREHERQRERRGGERCFLLLPSSLPSFSHHLLPLPPFLPPYLFLPSEW